MAPKINDARFARLQTDPRFRRPNKKTTTVEIDDRFKDVLESEEFGGKGKGKGKGKASEGARVDKRGRAVTSSHQADQLKRFYRLKSPSPSGEAEKPAFVDYARGQGNLSSSGSEDEGSDVESVPDEEEMVLGAKKSNRLPRYDLSSDGDQSGSEAESEGSHLNIDLSENEYDQAEEEEDEEDDTPSIPPTKRIAAVNLDWDNLRAADLYSVFNSFLSMSRKAKSNGEGSSTGLGRLLDVKIYPSQFGKERMEKEEQEGPGGGIFAGSAGVSKKKRGIIVGSDDESEEEYDEEDEDDLSEGEELEEDGSIDEQQSDVDEGASDDSGLVELDEEDDDDEDEDLPRRPRKALPEVDGLEIVSDVDSEAEEGDIDMDKLREYQLERLRYYYAVATFSSVAAAEFVMKECQGTEFERTANMFDLSYVPEDMDFGDDEVKDEATKELKGYKGNDFVTDALRHSKVKLTWDQDDPNRAKMTRRTLTREEIDEQDFNNLVGASSGSEDEAGPAKHKPKQNGKDLRALLLDDDGSDDDVWGKAGTAWKEELAEVRGQGKTKNGDMEITFRPALSGAKAVTGAEEENMTTLEKYQMRMKEKKARKKEKRELRAAGKADDSESEDEGKASKSAVKTKPAKGDDFFGDSSDEEEEEKPVSKAKKAPEATEAASKPDKKTTKAPAQEKKADLPADLPEELQTTTDHFSMKDILKAEKAKGKKKRHRTKKGKHDDEREVELGPDGWKLDVKDDRFKVLHEEPEFAIDPSNPAFTKTQGMKDLLAERAKIRAQQPHREVEGKRVFKEADAPAPEKDLSALVKSVKRRADGQAKPRKRSRK